MTARLMAQQEVEREARNRAGLLRWHQHTFGPEIGALLAAGREGYETMMTDYILTGTGAFMVLHNGDAYRVDPQEIRLP